jgi:selenocysteine-specific elongation factor
MVSGRAVPEHSQARSVILGTAGHIDHGKTALVRALTGIDTDRLPEEKRRGITIDLGFASLETKAPDGSALRLSFIDVPGHARFVRNMLAGAGGIDAVLLVISAEEGVKPQTEEHLAICTLLGIERGITVLTKCDAVSEERLHDVTRSLRNFLNNTFLAAAPLIAVSAYAGIGIEELRSETIRMAASIPARSGDTVVRLPIDRSFVMKGFGTVITGTLIAGSIRTADELAVEPDGRITKVRGIQVHGRTEEAAQAGSRVALNLTRIETHELERGDTLVAPHAVASVDTLDVELTVLHGAPPLKHRARVHFHAFASECVATATLYDVARVEPGETKLARLKLTRPVVLLPGDRFVLRQGSPITTVGGGQVLDAHPLMRTRKTKTAEWLRSLNAASSEEHALLRIARRGVSGISIKQLSSETGLTDTVLDGLMERWGREGRTHIAGERLVLTQESFSAAKEAILRQVRVRGGSGSTGIKRSQLKEQVGLAVEVFDDALQGMKQDGLLRIDGEFVAPFEVAPVAEHDRRLLSAIAKEYERAGVTPPSPEEAGARLGIAASEMRRLITLLLRDRTLVRIGSDSLCMDRRALEDLTGRVRALRGQRLDVTVFKQLAGVSRKYAIPLLEYFDRERVTVRQGDQRLVL